MLEKHSTVIVLVSLFLLFHLIKFISERPVKISKEDHKTLERIWYLEHEGWASSLTGDRKQSTSYDMESLLNKLPHRYLVYIDTQNYVLGTKVAHTQFNIIDWF